ncbi:MAG: SPFH domain-containing protein [Sulfuricella sp.]|nr:SPFH domain-containing protein [Sulfuricella sp.]
MSLMSFVKKQFIDILQWNEEGDGVLSWRYPMEDFEIQYGGQLVVRESQMAVFVNEGKIADVFGPGTHKLITQTLPVLTYLQNWDKLFESPFKSDVYFMSTRLQLGRRWGTQQPITVRDKDFGMVRMRAFGIYSYRIKDPGVFFKEVAGTRESYGVEDLEQQLRNQVVASMSAAFGESNVPFLDMAANQGLLGETIKTRLVSAFERFGLTLDGFVVENVSLPEEIQQALDKRISVGMMKDVIPEYTRLQSAEAITLAAQNEGGLAGLGAGLGVGLGAGQTVAGAMAAALAQPAAAAPVAAPAALSDDEIAAKIEKLGGLLAKGLITQAEFDQGKAELLKKLIG